MEPAELEKRWRSPPAAAPAALWDARAEQFDRPVPGPDDPYVALLQREGRLDRARTDVLDIGCGTGIYSMALAGQVRSVRGLDVSPRMIAFANRKAARLGLTNTVYEAADWETADPAALGRYGLVMAHMTPAVGSAASFAKMTAVAAGPCFLTGYVDRRSPIWDRIYELTGTDGNTESDKLLFAQDTLWRQGFAPQLCYERQHRAYELTPAEAEAVYLSGIRGFAAVTPDQEEEVRAYLRSLVRNGTVSDRSDPLLATLWWDPGLT